MRYNDKRPFVLADDFSRFNDPHFPVWYPAFYAVPSLRPLIFDLMAAAQGEHLGGVLINRVAPGKQIYPHQDHSWHADFYDKFNVVISGAEGSGFIWPDDDEVMPGRTGDVYHFNNANTHAVINHSDQDFILLAVCIRLHKKEPV